MFYETTDSGGRRRARVREVDFMRVEDASIQDALSPFEMEIKNKIAGEDSLRDSLSQEDKSQSRFRGILKRKFRKLLSKGVLTVRQREFYELFYIQRLTDVETAKRMGVSRVRVRKLRWALKKALNRAVKCKKGKEAVVPKVRYGSLTKNQKNIWMMYRKEKLSPVQIARKLGRTKQAVYGVLKNIQKKSLPRKNFD
ncbi:MAG TPA: hypothetical protein PLY88_04135 [Candidatus Omnitrophota bacterium]|nr:hypothetical protein [Candidatus Omnitrophota bacterium]